MDLCDKMFRLVKILTGNFIVKIATYNSDILRNYTCTCIGRMVIIHNTEG